MDEKLLKLFCRLNNQRYTLERPFVIRGWKYATNGHIAIRMPTAEADSPPAGANRPFPGVAGLFDAFPASECDTPWPSDALSPEVQRCEVCDGLGAIGCPNCNDACPVCEGHGEVIGEQNRTIGVNLVSPRYDRFIRMLPNVRYRRGIDRNSAIAFMFDGGQGMLAGLMH
jgi:hypothetical protein